MSLSNRLADHPRTISALFTATLLVGLAAPAVADSSGSTGGSGGGDGVGTAALATLL